MNLELQGLCCRLLTAINALDEGWVIDVTSGVISELSTEELEVFWSDVEGQEVKNTSKLCRRDHAAVSLALTSQNNKQLTSEIPS